MAKEKKPTGQRAITVPPTIFRFVPQWTSPHTQTGAMWRQFVRAQPIAINARDTLISFILGAEWAIQAKDSEQTNDLQSEIEKFTEVFNMLGGVDFDTFTDLVCQDILDLPFGAGAELGRTGDSPEGDLIWADHIDAATLYPTNDFEFPVAQRAPWHTKPIFFPRHAINRAYYTPRTEIRRRGWGMPPPEKIFLAVKLLSRGDRYYANLLLDTPEAGVLDLMDMSQDAAIEWIGNFQDMFAGADPFKVPVLYEHTAPAKWLPFGRPPTELIFDSVTFKYAQIVTAGYGLKVSDIGMSKEEAKTLAGVIRSERQTRRTGFAVLKSKLEGFYTRMLPSTLKFVFVEHDDESMIAKGRARLSNMQAFVEAREQNILHLREIREQIEKDGLFDVQIDPDDVEGLENPGLAGTLRDADGLKKRIPPSAGGRGEITGKSRAIKVDQTIESIFKSAYTEVFWQMNVPRVKRLARFALNEFYDDIRKVVLGTEIGEFNEIMKAMISLSFGEDLYGLGEDFASLWETKRAKVAEFLDSDTWWHVSAKINSKFSELHPLIIREYDSAATSLRYQISSALYEAGKLNTLEDKSEFSLTNRAKKKTLSKAVSDFVAEENGLLRSRFGDIIIATIFSALQSPHIYDAIIKNSAYDKFIDITDYLDVAYKSLKHNFAELLKLQPEARAATMKVEAITRGRMDFLSEVGLADSDLEFDGYNAFVTASAINSVAKPQNLWKGD